MIPADKRVAVAKTANSIRKPDGGKTPGGWVGRQEPHDSQLTPDVANVCKVSNSVVLELIVTKSKLVHDGCTERAGVREHALVSPRFDASGGERENGHISVIFVAPAKTAKPTGAGAFIPVDTLNELLCADRSRRLANVIPENVISRDGCFRVKLE